MTKLFLTLLVILRAAHAKMEEDKYDYVIVGGGVAGTIMANRLSESGRHSVLLLNVAGEPPSAYRGPVLLTDEFIVEDNLTVSQGLQVKIVQPGYSPVQVFSVAETGSSPARWLGGSSLVGLSLYLRDHPETLDKWGEGWGWKTMRKYFHKVESLARTCYGGSQSCGDYGTDGPVKVSKEPAYTHPLSMDFIAAAKAAGLEETRELNTNHGSAVGLPPTIQHADGTKVNMYDAYLRPVMTRSNLHVRYFARADRLIMHGDECKGVAYRNLRTWSDHVVRAEKEVIVSSGYTYTPRLLFLSGMGTKEDLARVGLAMVNHLPALGKHLTSARYSPVSWYTKKPTLSRMMGPPISPANCMATPDAYQSTVQEALGRFRSQKAAEAEPHAQRSDVVLTFMPVYQHLKSAPLQFSLQGEPWPLATNAYTMLVTLGETEAEGEVTFPSASPDVSPVVTHHPLTQADWELAQEACAFAMKVGNQSALGGELVPNGACSRNTFSAIYDGRGSCRMGENKSDSVVDSKLRVHGVRRLRIVDGSAIPKASPYLALPEVMALAERAADLVLEYNEKKSKPHQVNATAPGEKTYPISMLKRHMGDHAALMDMAAYIANNVKRTEEVELIKASDAGCWTGLSSTAAFMLFALVGLFVSFGKRIWGATSSLDRNNLSEALVA
jgi:choline dehydrogenase